MEVLGNGSSEKTNPIQSQSPSIGRKSKGTAGHIVNPEALRPGYLKKQSQFLKGQNDIKAVFIMGYEDSDRPGRPKNKANSNPIKANFKV